MAQYKVNDTSLTAVADAIRERAGTEDQLAFPDGFVSAVEGIQDYIMDYVSETMTTYKNHKLYTLTRNVFRHSYVKYYDIPNVLYVSAWCFAQSGIVEISLPKVTKLEWDTFRECNDLKKVELGGSLSYIQTRLFYNSKAFDTLILRNTTQMALYNIDAFTGTPIANGTGYIYVPRALVDSYKAATNWSNFSSQIKAIEDYPEITGG